MDSSELLIEFLAVLAFTATFQELLLYKDQVKIAGMVVSERQKESNLRWTSSEPHRRKSSLAQLANDLPIV